MISRTRSWRPDAGECGVLGLIALFGLVSLPLPFTGDQALFMVYARDLDAGSVLYRDVWDSKQPGIFFFYLLAGRLFGFTEIGAHALELLYLLAFSFVLMRTGRSFLTRRLARLALPLLTVGLYYMVARPKSLTQVEILAGFPLYLALWLGAGQAGAAPSRARVFAAGLMGGVVVWLKLYFLPVVAALWGLALVGHLRRERSLGRACRQVIVPALAGFALPVLGLFWWAQAHGVVGEMGWTYFVYPKLMGQALEPDLHRLGRTLVWFVSSFASLLLLAALGLATRGLKGSPLTAGALTWLALGALLIAGELSWWKYYTLILLPPLGVCASVGLDQLRRLPSRRLRLWLGGCSVAALLLPVGVFSSNVGLLVRHGLALERGARIAFQCAAHDKFAEALPQAEFIHRQVAGDETVYVLGNPLALFLAGSSYAIPINGWSAEAWASEVWGDVLSQLESRRPDYLFVSPHALRLMNRLHVPTVRFLAATYQPVSFNVQGTWYRRRGAGNTDARGADR